MSGTSAPMEVVEKTEDDSFQARCTARGADVSSLVLQFQSFVKALSGDEQVDVESQYQSLRQNLAVYENGMLKSQIQMGALSRQEGLIEETKASISKRIESTKTELNELKKRLAQEQVERSHREEYAAAAKLINKLPTRAELQGQIDKERAEFEAVQKEEQKISEEMNMTRKKFALFIHAVDQLRSLDEGEKN